MTEILLPLISMLGGELEAFLVVLARLSPIVFLMPGIGEQVLPVRVRLMVLLGVSVAFSFEGAFEPPVMATAGKLIEIMISELIIGVLIGITLRLCIWALMIAGSLIAQAIGLSQLLGFSTDTEAQTIVAKLLAMSGAALLLSMNFHVAAFAAIWELYDALPPGARAASYYAHLADAIFSAVTLGFLLAWPFVVVSLLYNLGLGFINKAMPQLMVAFVGAPFIVGAGLILMTTGLAALLMVWAARTAPLIGWM